MSVCDVAARERDGYSWLTDVVRQGFERLRRASRIAEERRQLRSLDHSTLEDIGLTRRAARREALRPFWEGRERG